MPQEINGDKLSYYWNPYHTMFDLFNTDLPFRINMAHVFLSCSFYLALIVALAVCALFIRLIGATPDPEPYQWKKTKVTSNK